MGEEEFKAQAKELVAEYSNEMNTEQVAVDKVYVVWSVKVLGNNKALLSTPVKDGRYYEVTYDGNKKSIYFDAYNKEKNIEVKMDK